MDLIGTRTRGSKRRGQRGGRDIRELPDRSEEENGHQRRD